MENPIKKELEDDESILLEMYEILEEDIGLEDEKRCFDFQGLYLLTDQDENHIYPNCKQS